MAENEHNSSNADGVLSGDASREAHHDAAKAGGGDSLTAATGQSEVRSDAQPTAQDERKIQVRFSERSAVDSLDVGVGEYRRSFSGPGPFEVTEEEYRALRTLLGDEWDEKGKRVGQYYLFERVASPPAVNPAPTQAAAKLPTGEIVPLPEGTEIINTGAGTAES